MLPENVVQAHEVALKLPLRQFFSVPFIRRSIACGPGQATKIATTMLKLYVKENTDMTVEQLIERLDQEDHETGRKKLLKTIGNKGTQSRTAFIQLCQRFGLDALLPRSIEMDDKDFELSDTAIRALRLLKT